MRLSDVDDAQLAVWWPYRSPIFYWASLIGSIFISVVAFFDSLSHMEIEAWESTAFACDFTCWFPGSLAVKDDIDAFFDLAALSVSVDLRSDCSFTGSGDFSFFTNSELIDAYDLWSGLTGSITGSFAASLIGYFSGFSFGSGFLTFCGEVSVFLREISS